MIYVVAFFIVVVLDTALVLWVAGSQRRRIAEAIEKASQLEDRLAASAYQDNDTECAHDHEQTAWSFRVVAMKIREWVW